MWLTAWPCRRSAAVRWRVLLQVQRNGESGAPRLVGSTNRSKSAFSVGSRAVSRLRPPPGRRTRAPRAARSGWTSSRQPAATTPRDRPVARDTWPIPPQPNTRASVPAHNRRWRSFKWPAINSYRCLIGSGVMTALPLINRLYPIRQQMILLFPDEPLLLFSKYCKKWYQHDWQTKI